MVKFRGTRQCESQFLNGRRQSVYRKFLGFESLLRSQALFLFFRRSAHFAAGLVPAFAMIVAARLLSSSTKRAKSRCSMVIGSAPCSASQERIEVVASAREMSRASFSTTDDGVPIGAQTPYQIGKSNP